MKKVSMAFSLVAMILGLTSCNFIFGSTTSNDNGGSQTGSNGPSIDLTNIPQYWVDLFTFDNVTIILKNNLTIKKGDEYRCVGGKWYYKYQSSEKFENHDGRNIYDLYLTSHSLFSFDEASSCYKALSVTVDESGYQRDIYVNISDGRIVNITDTATQNSSSIVTTLDFSNYGTTTIE